MFSIYAKNFYNGGLYINTETLIQAVPAESKEEIHLINPVVNTGMKDAGTMEFTMEKNSKWYNSFRQLKTYIRVDFDGETLFVGRVLLVTNSMMGNRKIKCEGAFTFLLDSQYPGVEDSKRPTISLNAYLQNLIDNHNTATNDPDKHFTLGEVPGNYHTATTQQRIDNVSRQFGTSSWTDTKAALEDLRSHYGGYFRVRCNHIGNGYIIDWLKWYFNETVNGQTIEVAKNIIDINNTSEVNNIFTALIPMGKTSKGSPVYITNVHTDVHGNNNYIKVSDLTKVYTNAQLTTVYHTPDDYREANNRYGMIFKTMSFEDAGTPEKVWEKALEWIKENYHGGIDNFTVKAIDLHIIGRNTTKILSGDRCDLVYPILNSNNQVVSNQRNLTCISASYNLYNPEQNSYNFGIASELLNKMYGTKNRKSVGGGGSSTKKEADDDYKAAEREWLDAVKEWLKYHHLYYHGQKPWREEYGNQYENRTDPYFVSFNYSGWKYITYKFHTAGHDTASWVAEEMQIDDLTTDIILSYQIPDYVLFEYGFDLRQDLHRKMPSLIERENGDIEVWEKNEDGTYKAAIYDSEDKALVLTTYDGKKASVVLGSDGNIHYLDQNGQEVTIRNLHIKALDSERKVGWVVEENGSGDLQFAHPGEMTLAIENYKQGELVVGRMNGDLLYFGSPTTRYSSSISLNHMDTVCGDIEYETEQQTGVKYMKVNAGGGMRVQHGRINPETGEFERDDQGNIIQAEFGVYDGNTLTGGVVVDQINTASWSAWAKAHTYAVGDQVRYDGKGYVCKTAHTSTSTFDKSKWNEYHATNTKIKGERVDIEASQVRIGNTTNVQAWMNETGQDLDSLEGVVTDAITAYDAHFARLDATDASYNTRLNTFEGSALWANRNAITGVVGEFEIETVGGVKTLKIKSGGGLKIMRNNTEFGVYDDGNLTGGIVVDRINTATWTAWTSNHNYAVGDQVKYNNKGYVCKTAHKSTSTFDTSKWTEYHATNTRITGSTIDLSTNDGYNQLVVDSQGLKNRVTNAEGNISTLQNTATGLTNRVTNAEGNISTLSNTTTGLTSRVSTAEGNISTLTNTASGLTSRVSNAEGNLSTLSNTVSGMVSTVSSHGQSISALSNTMDGVTAVTGEFEIKTVSGVKTVVIKSGGGLKIRRNNTEFGVYDNGNLTAGIICDKINGVSSATITADHIILSGSTKISGRLSLDTNSNLYIPLNDLVLHGSGAVHAKNYNVYANGHIYFTDSGGNIGRQSLDVNNVASLITGIKVVSTTGNKYKLQATTVSQASWTDVPNSTFSRAVTSMTSAWSNGTITATAQPQNQSFPLCTISLSGLRNVTYNGDQYYEVMYENANGEDVSTGLKQKVSINITPTITGTWNSGTLTVVSTPLASANYIRTLVQAAESWNGTVVTMPINARWTASGGGYSYQGTGFSASLNVSSKLKPLTGNDKITANGTYNPPSGYVGFSSVEVNVSGGSGGDSITWESYSSGVKQYNTATCGSVTSTIALNVPTQYANGGFTITVRKDDIVSGSILCSDVLYFDTISLTDAHWYDDNVGGNVWLGELYYKESDGTYSKVVSGNRYWYYSNKKVTSYSTFYYHPH